MALSEVYESLSQLAGTYASVWFLCWGLRRRYELDVKLSNLEQKIRWAVVAVASALTLLPGARLASVRIVCFLIGLCFIAWPNLAHHFVQKPRSSMEPEQ